MAMMTTPRARSAPRKEQVRYECRVMRSLKPNQAELLGPLALLEANTSELVDYRKPGNMGVTLMMLEPILRQILQKNRRGIIPRNALQTFEKELKADLDHAQYADYDIPLDTISPLALYGGDKNWLGLQLDKKDYRLVGDRAVVEEYMRANYDKPDGSPVSKRFIDKNSKRFVPHITIGEVKYENMDPMDAESFQEDPTTYLVRAATARMQANQLEFGSTYEVEQIIWPEKIGLNGLQVFCQQRMQ